MEMKARVQSYIIYNPCQVQRVFQVGTIKKILQEKMASPVTAKVWKQHYDRNLQITSGEAATEHFLQVALALYNALFSVPKLKAAWLSSHCLSEGC